MIDKNPFDAIRKKNLANIVAKVKAGRPLTSAETKTLDNAERERDGMRPDKTDLELADEFKVQRSTIHRAKKAGVKFDQDDALCYEGLKAKNMCIKWVKAYEKKNDIKAEIYKAESDTKSPDELRDEYLAELQIAKANGNSEREKVALNAYLKIDKQIRETALDEKKLGIQKGETLTKKEVERILKAIVYAGNACVRKQLKEVCEVIADCETPNDVYNLLPAMVLGGRIFEGMKAVSKSPSDVNLPQWAIDCMIGEGENYFENATEIKVT